jgi:hypothetical protein
MKTIEKMTSKYRGVYFHKNSGKWNVSIKDATKRYYLGSYVSELDAAHAYNLKSYELFGKAGFMNKLPADYFEDLFVKKNVGKKQPFKFSLKYDKPEPKISTMCKLDVSVGKIKHYTFEIDIKTLNDLFFVINEIAKIKIDVAENKIDYYSSTLTNQ